MTCRFTIYCHTNKVNGKRYIGQTVDTMDGRWREHVSAAMNHRGSRVFGAAIRKYGEDAFDHEILEIVGAPKDADESETKWIKQLQSRSPYGYNLAAGGGGPGYHHEVSKLLIGEASKRRLKEMTPEQMDRHLQNLRTPARVARLRQTNTTKEFSEKVSAGQKAFWSQLTPEDRSNRVRHQMTGMTVTQKSDRSRKSWANMTPEAREARVRKTLAACAEAKSKPEHSKKMSEWQAAQAKLRTPEKRREMAAKAWITRRARYGDRGHARSSEVFSAATKRSWENATPEARAERVRKSQEGRSKAKEKRENSVFQ